MNNNNKILIERHITTKKFEIKNLFYFEFTYIFLIFKKSSACRKKKELLLLHVELKCGFILASGKKKK